MKNSNLPLGSKTVLVTRASSQSRGLKKCLKKLGAKVLDFPVIRISPPKSWGPLDRALARLDEYDWIIFTSVNGVASCIKRLKQFKKSLCLLKNKKIAAIGEATAIRLKEKGIRVDLQPVKFTSAALFSELKRRHEIKDCSFLLPRADIAPDLLPENLRKAGARVTQITAYRTLPAASARKTKCLQRMLLAGKIDFVLFASSSTVRNFFACFPKSAAGKMNAKWVSIGPVTTRTLRDLKLRPYREAKVCTMDGMIQALLPAS